MVSMENFAAIHQIIVNGAALLASTAQINRTLPSPPPLPSSIAGMDDLQALKFCLCIIGTRKRPGGPHSCRLRGPGRCRHGWRSSHGSPVSVFKIPTRSTSGGYKYGEWLQSDKIWIGHLRVVSRHDRCEIRLVEKFRALSKFSTSTWMVPIIVLCADNEGREATAAADNEHKGREAAADNEAAAVTAGDKKHKGREPSDDNEECKLFVRFSTSFLLPLMAMDEGNESCDSRPADSKQNRQNIERVEVSVFDINGNGTRNDIGEELRESDVDRERIGVEREDRGGDIVEAAKDFRG
ncbi:hypothetical protein RHSIM_RhsimUnG0084200 [Rhododendron simsii]|uniref:NECAP PHear domain-containing protein n=1 Tax=Rhododendron simsii TaxID=118357 RepID=A0A834L4N2_RHOSS|nr:hypothetical protein RHSIM_RhsimUnG0084200 [Rhododendron simsii]